MGDDISYGNVLYGTPFSCDDFVSFSLDEPELFGNNLLRKLRGVFFLSCGSGASVAGMGLIVLRTSLALLTDEVRGGKCEEEA